MDPKVVLNKSGVRALLRSPEVLAELERRAREIAEAAGEDMEVDSAIGPARARASVRTASPTSMKAEAEDRALTKAIDAGR